MLNYLDVFLFVWNGPGSEKVFYNAPAGFLFYVLSAFCFTVSYFVSLFSCHVCNSRMDSLVRHWIDMSSWLLSLFLILLCHDFLVTQ